MNCHKCNKDNRDTARYCRHCGSPITATEDAVTAIGRQKIMDSLIGLKDVKDVLDEIYDKAAAVKRRADSMKVKSRLEMNFFITGESGTGKTRMANVICALLHDAGVVPSAMPLTIDAAEYDKWAKDIDKNADAVKGGVLLIENVQKLIETNKGNTISPLDPLFSRLGKWYGNPGRPIVILTGLPSVSDFMSRNTNVGNYFPFHFTLDPYTIDEIVDICIEILKSKYHLTLSTEAAERLERVLLFEKRDSKRTADNGHLAYRKASEISVAHSASPNTTSVVDADSVPGEEFKPKTFDEVMVEFDRYVGIEEIKDTVRAIAAQINERRKAIAGTSAKKKIHLIEDHFQFLGNPGTGKTTIARVFADALKALGALPIGHLVEVDTEQLTSSFVGETPKKVKAAVDRAMGGVLFIDEAYSLTNNNSGGSYGQEAVDTLIKYAEDRRGEFVIILAGYTKEMGEFTSSNPGIESRFNKKINFRDYKPEELTEIFRRMVKAAPEGFLLSEETDGKIINIFQRMYLTRTAKFGNARDVRNVLSSATANHAKRIAAERLKPGHDPANDRYLTMEDIEGPESSKPKDIDDILSSLDDMIGMEPVKEQLGRIAKKVRQDKRRAELRPGVVSVPNIHIAITGNPGTGKTEVARRLGQIFKAMGILPTDKIVQRERKTLLDSYSNSAGTNMDKAVDEALGGILFIDEAYNLAPVKPEGRDTIGLQAVEALMTRMSNDAGKFVTVIAGYKAEIEEFIANANPGLARRFTLRIHIPDYTADQLFDIFMLQVDKFGYTITDDAKTRLRGKIDDMLTSKDERFGNAGDIIKLFDETITRQSERLDFDATDEELFSITEADIPYDPPKKIDIDDCMKELDDLIGLKNVKDAIRDLADSISIEQQRAAIESRKPAYVFDHFLFVGNPGTGKTTVARIMGNLMYSLGLLPSNKVVETTPRDYIAQFVGQTAPKTKQTIDRALGGILFIDEAYGLNDGNFGTRDAMPEFLTKLIDYKGRMIAVAAGYPREIQQWLDTNSGLESRFTRRIVFADYSAEELAEIFRKLADKAKFIISPEAEAVMKTYFRTLVNNKGANFANAREARNYFDRVKIRQGCRLRRMMETRPDFPSDLYYILEEDDMRD